MKQIKTFLIAAIALLGMQTINAQAKKPAVTEAKIAHVDVNEIMTKMPAVIDAQAQLKKITDTYSVEIKNMYDELQAKLKKYDTEAPTVTEVINQTRQQEVQGIQKGISDFQENAQKDFDKKREDLMKPITDKVRASIQKIGKAKGYQYVLNIDDGILLADGPDLTSDVKKDLGF